MQTLFDTLERLSEAAYEALPLLEKHDYRKEADDYVHQKLDLKVIPKLLQDILNSLAMYCTPITYNGERIPDSALLNAENMRYFTENLNISGDWSSLRQLNHIDIEPIEDVKNILEQMGLSGHVRLLDNVCSFADSLRSHSRSHSVRPASIVNVPVKINVTLAAEDLTDKELQESQAFKEFNKIFRPGGLNSAQRKALYNNFRDLIESNTGDNPHLTIFAAILLLITKASYGRPLTGSLNMIRQTVFTSLGLPETTAGSYSRNALKPDSKQSLVRYKTQAETLLTITLGITR